jgi:hypothetical protein
MRQHSANEVGSSGHQGIVLDPARASAGAPVVDLPLSERPSTQPIAPDRYYELIRGQIEHEDDLMNTRLNWFITSQSFLFTAYAITAGNIQQPGTTVSHERLESLVFLIPMMAVVTSAVICFGIGAGVLALRTLRNQYHHRVDASTAGSLPPVHGYRMTQVLGISVPLVLPVLFMLVWAFLLLKGFRL